MASDPEKLKECIKNQENWHKSKLSNHKANKWTFYIKQNSTKARSSSFFSLCTHDGSSKRYCL